MPPLKFNAAQNTRWWPTQAAIRYMLMFVLFATNLATSVFAEVQTINHGKDLLMSCQQAISVLEQGSTARTVQNDAFLCMAYLSGVMATAQHANEQAKLRFALATRGHGDQQAFNLYCFDWQLPYHKIARIVLDFAGRDPRNKAALLNGPPHRLVLTALQTSFPCR